jgi:hypothetical protein
MKNGFRWRAAPFGLAIAKTPESWILVNGHAIYW